MRPTLKKLALIALLAGCWQPAFAISVIWTADLTDTGNGVQVIDGSENTWGNTYEYTDKGVTATVTAWAIDKNETVFQAAAVSVKAGGSGACNAPENGNVGNCLSGDNHARLDNKSQQDFLLIRFDATEAPAYETLFQSLDIFTPKNSEYELSYWIGTDVPQDLTGMDYSNLGANGFQLRGTLSYTPPTNSKVDMIVNHTLVTPQTAVAADYGNALLIGFTPSNTTTSEVYINSVVSQVPLPAPLLLLIGGLVSLGLFRRKA